MGTKVEVETYRLAVWGTYGDFKQDKSDIEQCIADKLDDGWTVQSTNVVSTSRDHSGGEFAQMVVVYVKTT